MARTTRGILRDLIRDHGTVTAFAIKCKVSRETVYLWLRSGRIPAERVPLLVAAMNGAVSKHELRPDLWGRTDG